MNKTDSKKLIQQFKEKESKKFLDSLPMSKKLFQELFIFLDSQLEDRGCKHSFEITIAFLQNKNIAVNPILDWIIENGQGCDCEVLNFEEQFDE